MRALTVRAVLFAGLGDFFPLYAIYALLFADHGLNAGQISSLFALWSATAFLLEVPSGAWADTVSRRGLLVLSGVLLTLGFTLWTVLPSYLGFAAGFVVWGISGALRSGTFEALLYDELSLRGEPSAFPRILGYTRAGTEIAVLIAILAATPLYLIGGYPLIGWVSVAMAAAHTCVALSLPGAPKAVSAGDVEELEEDPTGASVLTAGTSTAASNPAVGQDASAAADPSGVSSPSAVSDPSAAPDHPLRGIHRWHRTGLRRRVHPTGRSRDIWRCCARVSPRRRGSEACATAWCSARCCTASPPSTSISRWWPGRPVSRRRWSRCWWRSRWSVR
ncbi:MFS transporter [Nocardia cyriacigeorgica]|uniref:MFS transporter n=1 Tax=Nocardia cyriacigeorgica TaxID=135487 RepID=UPI001E36668E|nr:MFS transporter [Nocardia cyriacigeorgica]